MANVTLVGSGVVGMGLAMLLAADGHEVTCLERDAEPPPADAEAAWEQWDRRGVNQFRLLHTFLARFHQIVTGELPNWPPGSRRTAPSRTTSCGVPPTSSPEAGATATSDST